MSGLKAAGGGRGGGAGTMGFVFLLCKSVPVVGIYLTAVEIIDVCGPEVEASLGRCDMTLFCRTPAVGEAELV